MMCSSMGESMDTRTRFGIRFEDNGVIYAHCFNCKFKAFYKPGGHISSAMKSLLLTNGVPSTEIKRLVFEAYKEQTNITTDEEIDSSWYVPSWSPLSLPSGIDSIPSCLEKYPSNSDLLTVANYALDRGLDLNDLYWVDGEEHHIKNRFILPFHYRGSIVGYTGRYCGTTKGKRIPKYINFMPDNYVYNLDAQLSIKRKFVLLVEGVLDAYMIDGISPINNELNDNQIDIIDSLKKPVIVCPDRDKAGSKLVNIAKKKGWGVAFPDWEKKIKDPAQAAVKYGRVLTLQSIIETVEYDPLRIHLKWGFLSE